MHDAVKSKEALTTGRCTDAPQTQGLQCRKAGQQQHSFEASTVAGCLWHSRSFPHLAILLCNSLTRRTSVQQQQQQQYAQQEQQQIS
jgi:hypothetical protein